MNYYDPFSQFNPEVVDFINLEDRCFRQLQETGSNHLSGCYITTEMIEENK